MAKCSFLPQQPRVSGSQQRADQAMADGDSLKRSSSSSQAALSLLFSLEPGDIAERLSSSTPEGLNEYDPVTEVQRIKAAVAALSEPECKLAQAVAEAKASSILSTGSVQLNHVGSYLRSRHGYLVAIRHANAVKRPRAYLRMLYHKYLVIRGLEGLEGVDVLVDLNFRDHFVLPHSTGWYAKLLAALPNDWVGTAAALAPLVGLMSAGMRLCFKQAGVPLPPWREGRAVLSRWLPEAYEEEAPPLVPLPDGALRRMLAPYHGAPFRSALQRAAASELQMTADAAAAGGAAAAAAHCQAVRVCDQQQLASSARPPLPRPPSGVVLVTASVKAAAADAAAGAQQAVAGAGHSHHGQLPVVPDVPRKIIVGFPDQNLLPAASNTCFSIAAAATPAQLFAAIASDGEADADVLVKRQQQQQQQKISSNQQRAPAAGTLERQAEQQQADGEATVRIGRPAGGLTALQQPEPLPAGCDASDAAVAVAPVRLSAALVAVQPAAKAAAAATPAARAFQPNGLKRDGSQPAAAQALPRPAFTSAVGFVTALCSSTSPAVVISQQFLRQQQVVPLADQQQQQQFDESTSAVGGDSQPTAAGATSTADASNSRLRQFKALDQLLPRIRTIRLGAG